MKYKDITVEDTVMVTTHVDVAATVLKKGLTEFYGAPFDDMPAGTEYVLVETDDATFYVRPAALEAIGV